MRFDGIEYFFEWRGVISSFVIFGTQHGVERYYLDNATPGEIEYARPVALFGFKQPPHPPLAVLGKFQIELLCNVIRQNL
ncbi:MAG: hypothetical protein LWX08_01905 [Deltaproteobacteria bacterium]|nr:hypothetical protein [Deltaproteobacteria bacterium]